MWARTDVPGSELVVFDDRAGLHARGWQQAVDPEPYALAYELWTDELWATTRCIARCEGAGWTRDLELVHTNEGWDCVGSAHGAPNLSSFDGVGIRPPAPPGSAQPGLLRAAVDIDMGGSPLTNALPVRRLGLLASPPTHRVAVVSAWILPPTLEVIASAQTYTVLGEGRVRYSDSSTGVTVRYDADGWVDDYPGLARRV
jgi:hypothetical protein